MLENTKKISELLPVNVFTGQEWLEIIQKDGTGLWRSYRLQTQTLKGQTGDQGPDGRSAYQIAVNEEGFTGTKEEWLETLKALNPYELAQQQGFAGTLDEWLVSLKGDTGKSAYEIAVQEGYRGSEKDWLALNGTFAMVASESMAKGSFVNIWVGAGVVKARLADASKADHHVHGFINQDVTLGDMVEVSFTGINRFTSNEKMGELFLSDTPGKTTNLPPTTSGYSMQRVGVALSSTIMLFQPTQPIILA